MHEFPYPTSGPDDPTEAVARPEAVSRPEAPAAPPRRPLRRRLVVAAAISLAVLVLAAAALVVPADGDTEPTATAAADEQTDRPDRDDPKAAGATGSLDGSTTTTAADLDTTAAGLPGGGSSDRSPASTGTGGSSGPTLPRLEVVGEVVLDDGIYETDLLLTNAGDSALTWSGSTEAGDTLLPSAGVVAAGGQVVVHLTFDEYASNTKDWTHVVTFHSDGGDAEVRVHGTTLLPPTFEIAGGTFVNIAGNVYSFPTGTLNAVVEFKNEGDLPGEISFAAGANGRLVSPSPIVIEGGQTRFIAVAICGIPAPPVATSYDITLHIDAGPSGIGSIILRYRLNAGQATAPC